MIARNCGGVLPEPRNLTEADKNILAAADGLLAQCRAAMKTQQIHQALNAIWAVVADANRYFAGAAPWGLKKTDPERMGTVLYVTAEVIRQVAILAQPAMPDAAAKLLDLLAVSPDERNFVALERDGRLVAGVTLPPPEPVFPRYVGDDEAGTKEK
jgi:methionyl-tRNA synthetase